MSEALDLSEIPAGLPGRIHEVADRHIAASPHRTALIENGASWTYKELDRAVVDVAAGLKSLGVRAGDRMVIVSENCIALAALLLAVSRIDAWAIVANPRLSARELDQAVLSSHDAVVQCAVVGRAVEGNEEVVAFVQLMPGSSVKPADLMAFINPQLTSYKRPSEIVVLDALPATSTGKILKHKLAESLRGA